MTNNNASTSTIAMHQVPAASQSQTSLATQDGTQTGKPVTVGSSTAILIQQEEKTSSSAPCSQWVTSILALVSVALHITAFALVEWGTRKNGEKVGVLMICDCGGGAPSGGGCNCHYVRRDLTNSTWRGFQTTCTFAVVFMIFNTPGNLLQLFVSSMRNGLCPRVAQTVGHALSGSLLVATWVLFLITFNDRSKLTFGPCFYMEIVSSGLEIILFITRFVLLWRKARREGGPGTE